MFFFGSTTLLKAVTASHISHCVVVCSDAGHRLPDRPYPRGLTGVLIVCGWQYLRHLRIAQEALVRVATDRCDISADFEAGTHVYLPSASHF